jgi:hypothetical protein
MTDQTPDPGEALIEADPGDTESRQGDAEEDQALLAPTRNTRMRPGALDLAGGFD